MTIRTYPLEENQRAVIHTLLSAELAKQKKFAPWLSELTDTFANEHLLIEDKPVPSWELPMFTDEDRSTMIECVMDEVRDDIKGVACAQLDGEPLIEVIGYAVPAGCDVEDLARMLDLMSNSEQDYVTGSFLRDHDDDGDGYAGMLDFAKRMGLITETEDAVTPLGVEFKDRWS